jgi:DNA-3-methyladenine glycosylase I
MNEGRVNRCSWADNKYPEMKLYHDTEWGVPVHQDTKLFEFLVLEGAQAGLSWSTILKKRQDYRRAFDNFDVKRVAEFKTHTVDKLLNSHNTSGDLLKVEKPNTTSLRITSKSP